VTPRDFVLRAQRRLELTDGELARLCGSCRTAVVNWRSGRHEPSGRAVLAIVDRLVEVRDGRS
jgi:DNA-binding transcriptional regulator YiaG